MEKNVRRLAGLGAVLSALVAPVTWPCVAEAGLIADENAKPGTPGWDVENPGNAQFSGVIDLYPAEWSVKRGDVVRLKVRSTTSYSVTVYRLGWYDGAGARQVLSLKDRPADPQPYPAGADPKTGIVAAMWRDNVSFTVDGAWMPGLYVAKAVQAGGKEAMTYFTVRDDGASPKLPILLVVTAATHQAYNGWPGPERGGKSLYGFNSSAEKPSESVSNQAVKASLDRPYLVGGGTADVLRYEYPFVRWAEKNGFDLAYCNDDDLERDPDLVKGRRALAISGHWEYVSKAMYDAFEGARDAGTHLLFLSGDTLAWQVRYEDGGKTMVGYKEGWGNDPEHLEGARLARAGDIEGAKAHLEKVTRGWKALGYFPSSWGIDLRRPGMRITGVASNGGLKPVVGPWGHLEITSTSPWFFEGTGFKVGDVVRDVMGYEYDSLLEGDPYYAPFRPKGQVKTGALRRRSDNTEVGSTSYYKHASGADVVAWSAVNFAYALDDYAAKGWKNSSVDPRMQKLMGNLLTKWSSGAPTPGLPDVDAGPVDPGGDAGVPGNPGGPGGTGDASVPVGPDDEGRPPSSLQDDPRNGPEANAQGGCAIDPRASSGLGAGALALLLLAAARLRRRGA